MLSMVALIVLVFAVLGLLLGLGASIDIPQTPKLPENIADRDPALQQKLFEECVKDARFDGELTDDEYDRCAYSIYD
jgi:hypothetical protein